MTDISKTISTTISDTISEMQPKHVAERIATVIYADMVAYVAAILHQCSWKTC